MKNGGEGRGCPATRSDLSELASSLWFGLCFYFAQVEDDSEDDGKRNGGWRMMVWICYVGFVQVQNESDNGGTGRRWICWVNPGAIMGYGVLVGILRMKVCFFFCREYHKKKKIPPEWRRWSLFWMKGHWWSLLCLWSVPFLPRDVG